MATVISKDNTLVLNGRASVKRNEFTVRIGNPSTVVLTSEVNNIVWHLAYKTTTLDGTKYNSAKEMLNALQAFSKGGGSGNGAVISVTGNIVDNDNPNNPTVNVPVGTERQVTGYSEDGEVEAVTLGWKHFSDLPNPPSFNTGVLSGTTFTSGGYALFYFTELNSAINAPAKATTIPMYAAGGVLKVADGVANNDAINMGQLNSAIANIPTIISRSYTATGVEDNQVTLSSGILGAINPVIAVLPSNTDAILATLDSGWSYNSSNGNVTFNTSFLESGKTYTYTVLIKKE